MCMCKMVRCMWREGGRGEVMEGRWAGGGKVNRMYGWVDGWMEGWMDGWVVVWMCGCVGGWMGPPVLSSPVLSSPVLSPLLMSVPLHRWARWICARTVHEPKSQFSVPQFLSSQFPSSQSPPQVSLVDQVGDCKVSCTPRTRYFARTVHEPKSQFSVLQFSVLSSQFLSSQFSVHGCKTDV